MIMKALKMFWNKVDKQDMKRIASQTKPCGITECNDIRYMEGGSWEHLLDVYYPNSTNSPLPVIIDIHGGGWMYGKKHINKYYCMKLSERGYVVVNINYSLVPDVNVEAQLNECQNALLWVKNNISNYFGNTEKIFLTGDSAGGFLAAYSSLLNSSPELCKLFGTTGANIKLNAVALTSPACFLEPKNLFDFHNKAVLKNSNLKEYMNIDKVLSKGNIPPCFIVTSSGDVITKSASQKLYKLLEDNRVKTELMYWEKTNGVDLPHVFSVIDPFSNPDQKTIDKMLSFFNSCI